jgi:hypothetical protein
MISWSSPRQICARFLMVDTPAVGGNNLEIPRFSSESFELLLSQLYGTGQFVVMDYVGVGPIWDKPRPKIVRR